MAYIDSTKIKFNGETFTDEENEVYIRLSDVKQAIEQTPKEDVTEVRHGEWIKQSPNPEAIREFHKMGIGTAMSENSIFHTCSECGMWGKPYYKYCFNCGTKMDIAKNATTTERSDTYDLRYL